MIGFDIRKLFFDSQAVIARVEPATRKVLSKFELAVPQDGMLKVEVLRSDIQQGQKNSSAQSKEEKAK